MIDQYSDDGTGWARFGDTLRANGEPFMRYRLARSLDGSAVTVDIPAHLGELGGSACTINAMRYAGRCKRVVWLMLNPSTATAFALDPTVNECRKRSIALGAYLFEVVNLFALRSPYPASLLNQEAGARGDDPENDAAILAACQGAFMVVAAWGNHGNIDGRADRVRKLLAGAGIKLHHLGMTKSGAPKHPLARGVHRIPADLQPVEWT